MADNRNIAIRFLVDERGAAMVEYGLLIAFIAIVVAVAAITLGTAVKSRFTNVANCAGDATKC